MSYHSSVIRWLCREEYRSASDSDQFDMVALKCIHLVVALRENMQGLYLPSGAEVDVRQLKEQLNSIQCMIEYINECILGREDAEFTLQECLVVVIHHLGRVAWDSEIEFDLIPD